jgi:NNP family nitrate/nitrite transporter-like MFS transporter
MEIYSPGKGIMAKQSGMVQEVSDTSVVVGSKVYPLVSKSNELENVDDNVLVFPTKEVWHEPSVEVGQEVERKQLLAKGVTRIYFQANVWIFAVLVILLGSIWGVGKAAVYKYIPDYFPQEIGVVGGMVGVLGGLGGFFCPIIFGYLLEGTGLWTSCWMFMFFISAICLWWLNSTVQKMMREKHPESVDQIEHT